MEQKKYIVRGSSFDGTTWFVNLWGLSEAIVRDNCKHTREYAEELVRYLKREDYGFKYQIEEL